MIQLLGSSRIFMDVAWLSGFLDRAKGAGIAMKVGLSSPATMTQILGSGGAGGKVVLAAVKGVPNSGGRAAMALACCCLTEEILIQE